MPGTPSFRGCDACKRQKKKCDDLKPACSRCQRLRIQCTGRGVLQYRFKNNFITDSAAPTPAKGSTPSACPRATARARRRQQQAQEQQLTLRPLLPLVKAPSNETTQTLASFVSILEITDPRYDLNTVSYWLADLPRRYGTNKALDMAMQTVSVAFPCFSSKKVTTEALEAYDKATKYVHLYLNDARSNVDTECMCAIFLLLVAQEWIGRKKEQESLQSVGLVYLRRSSKQNRQWNELERNVRRTLSLCTILESFFQCDVDIKDLIDIMMVAEGPRPYTRADGKAYSSLTMSSLVKLPTLLKEPVRYHLHIQQEYKVLGIELPLLRKQLLELRDYAASMKTAGQEPPVALQRLISSVRGGYSVALGTQIHFVSLLQENDPTLELSSELDDLCGKAIELSVLSQECRPMGSGVMFLPLTAAWVTTKDPIQKSLIMNILMDFLGDFPEVDSWPAFLPVNLSPSPTPRPVGSPVLGSC